jgi:hypothetical protein
MNKRRSNLGLVNDTTQLTVPEAARRLGLPGDDVYRLIFRGVLVGAPSEDGAVYVSAASVDEYRAKSAAERVIEA